GAPAHQSFSRITSLLTGWSRSSIEPYRSFAPVTPSREPELLGIARFRQKAFGLREVWQRFETKWGIVPNGAENGISKLTLGKIRLGPFCFLGGWTSRVGL